ncbi:uncharacterized protein LOC131143723 [Malania oleifera]|uniref:uncharacterized protein LOC131143723 n=1 Tax=Malania oleifera TaxID=397392 RepID=UPI0025ADE039|nr:uncharacterized protein LOC131143723 [Malania oleifera]
MAMMKNGKPLIQQLLLHRPMTPRCPINLISSPPIRELLYQDRCRDADRFLHSIWRPNPASNTEPDLFSDDDALRFRITGSPFGGKALAGARRPWTDDSFEIESRDVYSDSDDPGEDFMDDDEDDDDGEFDDDDDEEEDVK